MTSLPDLLPASHRDAARPVRQPRWIDPMLATLTDERFSRPDWIYERKLDGERFLVFRKKGQVRLVTRNREERNATYPELVEELEQAGSTDWVADGEVVTFSHGVTSFSRLQRRMHVRDESEARRLARSIAVHLYLFDLPWAGGYDLSEVPLRQRKRILRRIVDFGGHIHYTPHRNEDGVDYWKEACRKGWEGVVAKRASSEYVGARSKSWLKFKCAHRQELVVGGFTEPQGGRVGFGALHLGYYDGGDLVHAGKVGTGWDDEMLETLRARLEKLARDGSPFDRGDPEADGSHWVEPELVVEVGFTEWTDAGKLRHPRFIGLRSDKDPSDVRREAPDGSS